MTDSAAAERVRALALLCDNVLRRHLDLGIELKAVQRILADRGIELTEEELQAARRAVSEVFTLEDALLEPEQAAERAALVEQLRRLLEEPETPPPSP